MSWLPVPMSSICSPMDDMGRRGSEALHDILTGIDREPELLEPTLAARDSTLHVQL